MAQQPTPTRKRANNRQKEILVERLHANIELARADTAQREVIDFWIALSSELNRLGCSRTVQEWQHIWTLWVSKVKTKARKIRDTVQATGEDPAQQQGPALTDLEEKILDIVGFDTVNGFGDSDAACSASPQTPEGSSRTSPVNVPPIVEPQILWNTEARNAGPTRSRRSRVRGRRSTLRRPVIRPVDPYLIESLNENSGLMRDKIGTAAETIAGGLVRAAEIIAAAIRSAGVQQTRT